MRKYVTLLILTGLFLTGFIFSQVSYYSYMSGDWDTADSWTTDPSGTTLQNPGVPGASDNATILDGRTITNAAGSRTVTSLTIDAGGILDIAGTTVHNFGTVSGQGKLRLTTMTFPSGTFTEFFSKDGGTVEFYNYANGSNLPASIGTMNNLEISNSVTTRRIDLNHNLHLNGSLTINSGYFRLENGDTGDSLIIGDDLTIESDGRMYIRDSGTRHQIVIGGNMTNNGTFYMSNETQYTNTTNAAEVTFIGEDNNVITGTGGATQFYRLIIDKGSDQTYILDIDVSNFALFGPTNQNNVPDGSTNPNEPNPVINKALWVKNGTCKLESGIYIEELTFGGDDFYIPLNGCLWINGADVEATRAGTGDRAITIIGKFRISDGSYSGTTGGGFIYRLTGEIVIEGGFVNLSQLRSSYTATYHRESYNQSGGTVLIRGNYSEAGEVSNGYSLFSAPYTDNVFTMSGGTLTIQDVSTDPGTYAYNALEIGCDESNINVTGGTLNLELQGDDNYVVNSTAPFYNVNVTEIAAGNALMVLNDAGGNYPLEVLNDLTIGSNTGLTTNNRNVIIGGNFTVSAPYTYGTNTTTFNSTFNNQVITLNTTTTFNDLTVNNTGPAGNDSVKFTGPQSSVTVRDLTLTDGVFFDNGKVIIVNRDVTNSASHVSSGSGCVRLYGGSATHVISGDGNGVFGNMELNDSNGASFSANQTINNSLTLTLGVLNIGVYNLKFNSGATVSGTFSGTRMIRTAGNRSDGGVSRVYSGSGSFTFPFGTASDYTPATINVTAASSYGTLTVRPVALRHPNTTSTNALNYYWRVTSSGFTSPTVTSAYVYVTSDIVGTEANYVSGRYNPSNYTWTQGTTGDVVDGTNTINFTNLSIINSDYTAGYPAAFSTVTIYYSRQDGDWETASTWSNVSHGGAAASTAPTSTAPVVIGGGVDTVHVVTVTTDGGTCGSLKIDTLSVLALGTTTGHNFGYVTEGEGVTGNGTLRISASDGGTAVFPGGDFGSFLAAGGGTVDYYGSDVDFNLPATPTSYNNLSFSGTGTSVLTMPDANLIIYKNLIVNSGTSQISDAANGNLTIYGSINVAGGTLQFQNDVARNIYVYGDVTIGTSGSFLVLNSGTAVNNTLTIEGSITNNNTFNMYASATMICDITFAGTTNESINGTGATTDFNRLILNKGSSQTAELEINNASFRLQAAAATSPKPLELQNGTVKLTSAQALTLSSGTGGDYTIPATAALEVNGVTTSITATNGGLLLIGKLKVSSGSFTINQYVEYSATGTAELEVSGGMITVGYQVRRSTSATTGVLKYTQSGGTLTVGSNGAPASTRAMFEVLNYGSSVTMSGGTLVIVRSQGGSLASLYLAPYSSSITGGTVQIGNNSTPAAQNITINSTSSLYNLTIDNSSATPPTAALYVSGLAVLNDLTINSGTTFNASGLNLNIGGDFTNSGTYTTGNNTTTFNGNAGAQTVSLNSATSFYNLTINNSSVSGDSVTLSGSQASTTVNNVLTLTDGIFSDGGKTINALGNVVNSATHASTGAGKIVMGGSAAQTISGSGSGAFGALEINNSANVLTSARITINDSLIFTNGVLNIASNQLILGSSFNYSGTVSASRMIRTSGSLSDNGVTKNFAASTGSFTFPVGSVSKYTPATYNITSISAAGTITVRPVNSEHPSTTDATADSALDYYWRVRSTGFSGGLTLTHTYQYVQADVDGDEAQYEGARLSGTTWIHDGTVNTGTHEITFTNYPLNCDYTAGDTVEFGIIPSYRSVATGFWDVAGTWDIGVPTPGAIVIISPGDVVTIRTNSILTTLVADTGTLVIGTAGTPTYGHNFNTVYGTGTIQLHSGTFPGGDFTDFFSSSGGTIEYAGYSYTLSNRNSYNNLTLSGATYTKTFANTALTLYGNLTVSSGTANGTVNNPNFTIAGSGSNAGTYNTGNGTLNISGSWTNTGTLNMNAGTMNLTGDWTNSGTFTSSTGTVNFVGGSSAAQAINGTTTPDNFYRLNVNMSGNQLNLSKNITISNQLGLTSRNIVTGTYAVTLALNATYTGGSSASFISGSLTRVYNSNTNIQILTYPTGKGGHYLPVDLGIQLNAATQTPFTVEQFNGSVPSYALDTGLYGVSLVHYWDVAKGAGATVTNAQITIRWNESDDVEDIADLVVAHDREGATTWYSEGGTGLTGGPSGGSVTSSINFTTMGNFVLGTCSEDNPLPVEMDDASIKLTATRAGIELYWETISEFENLFWRIKRKDMDGDWEIIKELDARGNSAEGSKYRMYDKTVKVNERYQYIIADVSYNGVETEHGPFEIRFEMPYDFKLHQNYPNPFNPTTRINFDLSKDGQVTIMIYNVLGQKVKTLYNHEHFEAGYKTVSWNGRNDSGLEVSSGIYFLRVIYRMSENNKVFTEMKKMMILK
jgi:fibronectin-binding autotransporter adhesin